MLKALAMFLGFVTSFPFTVIILGCLLFFNLISCRILFQIKNVSFLFFVKIVLEVTLVRFSNYISNNLFHPFKFIMYYIFCTKSLQGHYISNNLFHPFKFIMYYIFCTKSLQGQYFRNSLSLFHLRYWISFFLSKVSSGRFVLL